MTARTWFALVGAALYVGVTITLVATRSPWTPVAIWAFWGAIAVGFVVRMVRAARRGRARDALRPAGQGIDEVQDLYLGRTRHPVTYGSPETHVAAREPAATDPLEAGGPSQHWHPTAK